MTILRLRVFTVFALGYFISYLFRGVNIGFAPFLSREMGLTAVDLGTLTSVYFLGFAGAQIPAGVLLDHFGARRVTACIMLFAVAGALMFALSHSMAGMVAGRLLIGVGVSVCLVGAFKATAQHFEITQLALVNGMVTAAGGVGAVAVGAPLSLLLNFVHWRTVSLGLAVFTACVAAIIWVGAPIDGANNSRATLLQQLKGSLQILRSYTFWKLATLSSLTQAVFYAMQSLWVGAFLRDVVPAGATDASRVGSLISVLGASFIIGNVGFGALARALEKSGVRAEIFSGTTMAAFIAVQLLIACRVSIPEAVLWAAYGALGGTGVMTYAVLSKHFPSNLIGRINTTFTLIIFIGVFVVQIAVGNVLGHWPELNGHYPVVAHQTVWLGLAVIQALGALWYFAPSRRPKTIALASETD